MPDAPSVLVLPGTGKTFDRFRSDEAECRTYAQSQPAGEYSSVTAQQRYDFGYQQCMYAKGHKIPMSVREARSRSAASPAPAAPRIGTSAPPPPPPGQPPPETPADYKG